MIGDGIGVASLFFSILFFPMGRVSNKYEMMATTPDK